MVTKCLSDQNRSDKNLFQKKNNAKFGFLVKINGIQTLNYEFSQRLKYQIDHFVQVFYFQNSFSKLKLFSLFKKDVLKKSNKSLKFCKKKFFFEKVFFSQGAFRILYNRTLGSEQNNFSSFGKRTLELTKNVFSEQNFNS